MVPCPRVERVKPQSIRIVVVFPAPFAPRKPKISPSPIAIEMPLTATVRPKRFPSPSKEITGPTMVRKLCSSPNCAGACYSVGVPGSKMNPIENILNDREQQMTVLSPLTAHHCGNRTGNSGCATRPMAKERQERRKHDQNQRQLKYEAGYNRDREWFQHR